MAKKATKRKQIRERTKAQIDSELRREKHSEKTLVRHTEQSSAALSKLRDRIDESDPEIMRVALIEMAAKKKRIA